MKSKLLSYYLIGMLLCAFFLLTLSCRDSANTAARAKTAADAKAKQVWTCSMHPEVIRDGPGSCPICGMDLIKKQDKADVVKGIALDDLLQPTDQFIVSSIPLVSIQSGQLTKPLQVLGSVSYDTRHIYSISARVSGRIEKLYVHYRYQHIRKGERIMDIYSPELSTAQQELLFFRKNDPENVGLFNAAKQKLLLLGMTEQQITSVINSRSISSTVAIYSNYEGHLHEAGNNMPLANLVGEKTDLSSSTQELPVKQGMYVQQGQNIFQIFNTDNIWVLLNIFPEYQGSVKIGNPVRIFPETNPALRINGKIDFIEPVYRQGSKTTTARVYLKNSISMIPVGSQVHAEISIAKKSADWLPKDAVLTLGVDKIVFRKTNGGFQAHKVETGLSDKDRIEIVSGLNATDSVAANGQFLADSESFIAIKK